MRYLVVILWLGLISGAAIASSAASIASSESSSGDIDAAEVNLKDQLDALEKRLETAESSDLIPIRTEVRTVRAAITETLPDLTDERDTLAAELAGLGDPPSEDEPPEAEEVATERARLNTELSAAKALVIQAELNNSTATKLINEIAEQRRGKFYDQVFVRQPSPLRPSSLDAGFTGFLNGVTKTQSWALGEIEKRRSAETLSANMMVFFGALALAFVFIVPIRRRLNKRVTAFMSNPEPSHGHLVLAALFRALARALPAILGGFIVFVALRMMGLVAVDENGETGLAGVIWLAFVSIFAIDGIVSAVTGGRDQNWRLLPLSRASNTGVRLSVLTVVSLLAIDAVMRVAAPLLNAPQETIVLQSAIVAIGLMVLWAALGRPKLWSKPSYIDENRETWLKGRWSVVPAITFSTAIITIGLVVAGYVPLGYFAATRIFYLLGLVGFFIIARAVLRELLYVVIDRFVPATDPQSLEAPGVEDEESGLKFWLGLILDIGLALLTLIPAALALGADWIDVRDAVSDAFFGFTIGSVTISISAILAAIATFMIILWVTRMIQLTADTQIFPKTKMDEGVRNSFRTLIGYAGFTLAFLAALGVVGANLASLAIVAGALSVGIGFGLQSVVSNFVSGLILLFERPIKVGDWIVTSSGQGLVRRISVRSTEIEAFDRSSIIVPNSELIANSVTNMTLGNKLGRVVLPVGVGYDSDPEQVMAMLLELAVAHPKVLQIPEPSVIFSGLGDSSLDFELRAFVRDIGGGVRVSSDLRVAIFKRLNEANIDIPFPQRVVHHAT